MTKAQYEKKAKEYQMELARLEYQLDNAGKSLVKQCSLLRTQSKILRRLWALHHERLAQIKK